MVFVFCFLKLNSWFKQAWCANITQCHHNYFDRSVWNSPASHSPCRFSNCSRSLAVSDSRVTPSFFSLAKNWIVGSILAVGVIKERTRRKASKRTNWKAFVYFLARHDEKVPSILAPVPVKEKYSSSLVQWALCMKCLNAAIYCIKNESQPILSFGFANRVK